MSTAKLPRSKSTGVISASTSSAHKNATTSPLVEREDPFNLAGFFPSHRSASVDHFNPHFQWTQRISSHPEEDEEEEEERDGVESPADEMWPRTPGLMCEGGYAKGVLTSEDKLGILALDSEQLSKTLGGVFSGTSGLAHGDSDQRLFSPYADEDAVDDESLCAAVRSRRAAAVHTHVPSLSRGSARQLKKHLQAKTHVEQAQQGGDRFGELFLPPPPTTQAKPPSKAQGGWGVPLYKQMQEFVDSL